MISDDSQPGDTRDETDAASKPHEKPKWVMTQEAFDKLLNAFSEDRDDAGELYERTRVKLTRYFEWHSVGPADELVDETFNRVARRLDEGQTIDNLLGFIHGVANMIRKEALKKRPPVSIDDEPEAEKIIRPDPPAPDPRLACFDKCLEKLSRERQDLIVDYYQQELRHKINRRQKLAERLGIPLNALRIRAHRIRMTLETCITQCIETEQGETNRPL